MPFKGMPMRDLPPSVRQKAKAKPLDTVARKYPVFRQLADKTASEWREQEARSRAEWSKICGRVTDAKHSSKRWLTKIRTEIRLLEVRFEKPFEAGKPFENEARFLKSWFDNPMLAGAISPSGKELARAMAAPIANTGSGFVVELGPGTGPVTEALLARGIAEEKLVLVEFNPEFCALLRQKFPAAHVIEGDAYSFEETLKKAGFVLKTPLAAVVSSLPLLTKPERIRAALARDAFMHLAQGAPFVQFTYGATSPLPKQQLGLAGAASPMIWRNLPPARVWVYRKYPDGRMP